MYLATCMQLIAHSPVIGANKAEEEKLLRKEDKEFLRTLRNYDTLPSNAPPRATQQMPLPSVFQRLTDHNL